MHKRSSNSVRHDAVPRETVLAAARKWARAVRERHPEIVRIGYFGSYAGGDFMPGSDLDVLIEVSEAPPGRRADRGDPYYPRDLPVGVDLFVYTTQELNGATKEESSFLATVNRQVAWLE